MNHLYAQFCYFTVAVFRSQPEDTGVISQQLQLSITEGGHPLNMASLLHLEETFFGIAPHLDSLQGEEKNTFIMNVDI